MPFGKILFNIGTSYIFGPFKYGVKLLIDPPEKRVKNLLLLGCSLICGAVIYELISGATEVADSAAELYDSTATSVGAAGSASVIALADVGVLDTINADLLGDVHPETDVPFHLGVASATGAGAMLGVFPDFESLYDFQLSTGTYFASDDVHFRLASHQLFQDATNGTTDLNLSMEDRIRLYVGEPPQGYVWHHAEKPGLLQLVDERIHSNTGHTGGREIWGGGEAFR